LEIIIRKETKGIGKKGNETGNTKKPIHEYAFIKTWRDKKHTARRSGKIIRKKTKTKGKKGNETRNTRPCDRRSAERKQIHIYIYI